MCVLLRVEKIRENSVVVFQNSVVALMRVELRFDEKRWAARGDRSGMLSCALC